MQVGWILGTEPIVHATKQKLDYDARFILSFVDRFYDPMGLLGSVVTRAKIVLPRTSHHCPSLPPRFPPCRESLPTFKHFQDLQGGTLLLLRCLSTEFNRGICSLAPFVYDAELLRFYGRLRNSELDFDGRHPIISPRGHPITSAIVTHSALEWIFDCSFLVTGVDFCGLFFYKAEGRNKAPLKF